MSPLSLSKTNPGTAVCQAELRGGHGANPFLGASLAFKHLSGTNLPRPDGALGRGEGPGAALGSAGSAREAAPRSPSPFQLKVDTRTPDASAGGLRVGCARSSHRNAPLGCDHGQIRPKDFTLVHLM